MAAGGGYNAPNLADTSNNFGSGLTYNHEASTERNGNGGGGGVGLSSHPLFGVDFKR